MDETGDAMSAPLFEAAAAASEETDGLNGKGATAAQTLGNIVVSIVGTGVLGLPYAFRVAGWLAGSLGVAAGGVSTLYCMLLLVKCRQRLEQEEEASKSTHVLTYGDLGAKAFGVAGRYLTELLIVVAQSGASIAYLVFIGQNLSSIFNLSDTRDQQIMPTVFIFLLLLPLQILLSFIRSLSSLAPFSAFADICNVLAMAIVIKQDIQQFDSFFGKRNAFNGPWGLSFAGGVAVFCFEGFTMTLALEASMAERRKYPRVLSLAFFSITIAYLCFGLFGYMAYGDETKDIITLNLPPDWSATLVKIGLCIALAFTFPIMMHPIHEIIEKRLMSSGWFQLSNDRGSIGWLALYGSRILVLFILSLLASFVPGFGAFISLIGSTVCALLSFVLPAAFHLIFLDSSMKSWQRILDYGIIAVGLAFAVYGTYDAISGHSGHS